MIILFDRVITLSEKTGNGPLCTTFTRNESAGPAVTRIPLGFPWCDVLEKMREGLHHCVKMNHEALFC